MVVMTGVMATSETYSWSPVTQKGQRSHGGVRKTVEIMTSGLSFGTHGTLGSIASL